MIKVVYAGHDYFGVCLSYLRQRADVQVCVIATNSPTDPRNAMVQDTAGELGIPILSGPPDQEWVEAVRNCNVDLLICAAYNWRIPIEQLSIPYAVNVHPSMLPGGRGPNPMPYFIDEYPEIFGVTLHQLTSELDRGPIVLQEHAEVDIADTVDTLYLKTLAIATNLLGRLLNDLGGSFSHKREQGSGSYWPEYSWKSRTFRVATTSVHDLQALDRKFGLFGLIASLETGEDYEIVVRGSIVCESALHPGTCPYWNRHRALLVLNDGLALVSFSRHG